MKIHQLTGYIQSIYLIEYPDKLLLLDGCCRADISTLKEFIEKTLQRPFTDLNLVVVTHMHPDHAGGAAELKKLTNCDIAVANIEGQWYRGIDGFLMYITDVLLAYWVAKRLGKPRKNLFYKVNFTADHYVDDEQRLPGFNDWQAIYTQGHTDRDLTLVHIDSQKAYVADLIVKVKNKYIPPLPVFYPNRYLQSIKRIKQLNLKAIWLAHGGEVSLTESDYTYLLEKAPRVPTTHWRSVKIKLKKILKG